MVFKLIQENADYNFLLDGQTIMIDDYLEVRPEKEELLRNLISQNRITIGPWYVVPDTLIPSGESLIKNLQIGARAMKQYNGRNPVGYCPDSFGIISQMPQLFASFGYTYMHFTRGLRTADKGFHAELSYSSPDGSALLALYDYYSSGFQLSFETPWKNMFLQKVNAEDIYENISKSLIGDKLKGTYQAKNRLYIVGIDHAEPKTDLIEIVDNLNNLLPDINFVMSTQERFFTELEEEACSSFELYDIRGEQRGPYDEHFILSDVLTTRMDLKMLNRKTENTLERYASPIKAFNDKLIPTLDFDFDTGGLIDLAWKELVANHAHDSICACSVDETLDDIMVRVRGAFEIASDVTDIELRKLASNIKVNEISPACILVYNPLPYSVDYSINEIVKVPYNLDGTQFVVCDAEGNVIENSKGEFVMKKRLDIESEKTTDAATMQNEAVILLENSGARDVYTFIRIHLNAKDLPACGYRCYYLKESPATNIKTSLKYDIKSAENPLIKIAFNINGSFNLTDKKSGAIYINQNLFFDDQDLGDTYSFSPGANNYSTENLVADITVGEANADFVEYIVKHSCITKDNENIINLASFIRLSANSDIVQIKTTVLNNAYNHRLRVCFEAPTISDSSFSDTAFDLPERPIYEIADRNEKSMLTYPMRNLMYTGNADCGLVLLSASSHQYECYKDESTKTTYSYLTLLRSVESVYKMVTLTKDESEYGVGTRWWSDKAKMLGESTYEYAIKPMSGNICKQEAFRISEKYHYRPVVISEYAGGSLNYEHSFCEVANCVLSSVETITLNDDRSALCLRVFNVSDADLDCSIKLSSPIQEAFTTDLKMSKTSTLKVDGNTILFKFEHNKIQNIIVV